MSIIQTLGGLISKSSIVSSNAVQLTRGGKYSPSTSMTFREASQKGYKSLTWVRRCITTIGDAVGSVPWKTYKDLGDGRLKELPTHPLTRLLNHPNRFHSRKEFCAALTGQLSLSGNAYIEVVKVNGKPKEMYTINPSWCSPFPDPNLYVSHYVVDPSGGTQKPLRLELEDVIHFKYYDPENEFVGCSPISSARKTIELEHSAIQWNQGVFDNSAVPGGVLKVPANTIKPQERAKLKQDIETGFTKENIGKPMILWGGMEWETITMSPQDIEFLKQRQINKYEVCAIFGVPPQMVGANEDPTYANYEVARQSFWEDRVITDLEWLQIKYQESLAHYYGDDIVVLYDISDIPALRKSYMQKVETAKSMYQMGYPANELNRRLRLGMKEIPWGDVWWTPMNMMPVDNADISQYVNNTAKTMKEGEGHDPFEDPS